MLEFTRANKTTIYLTSVDYSTIKYSPITIYPGRGWNSQRARFDHVFRSSWSGIRGLRTADNKTGCRYVILINLATHSPGCLVRTGTAAR
jgi:hypothetical protein